MSTSSFIGIKRPSGYIKGIYCHHDGYPEYVGTILTYKYRNITKIEKLLALGDISILGEYIEPKNKNVPHTVMNYQKKTVVAYNRDGNEDLVIRKNLRFEDIINMQVDYIYLWNLEHNVWHTYKMNYDLFGEECAVKEMFVNYKSNIDKLVENGYMTSVSKSILSGKK